MSDSENIETKKRGRSGAIVGDKRQAASTPPKKDDKVALVDGETPAKRGRGRPKGSTKKNGGSKQTMKKSSVGKGRGRPTTKKKDDSTEDETEGNDETEENDEENESGSD